MAKRPYRSLKSWWSGIERVAGEPQRSKLVTAEEIALHPTPIQSGCNRTRSPRALTSPASWIAPTNRSSPSVSAVLLPSGHAMISKGMPAQNLACHGCWRCLTDDRKIVNSIRADYQDENIRDSASSQICRVRERTDESLARVSHD